MDLNATLVNNTDDTDVVFLMKLIYWERILVSVLLGLISIVGIIGNSMIILSVAFSPQTLQKTRLNVCVINFSLADLFASISLIWFVASLLGEHGWPLSKARQLCESIGFVLYGWIGVSMWSHGLLDVYRLICLLKKLVFTTRTCRRTRL